MKTKDIVIGATYQTRISGALRPVTVLHATQVRVGSWSAQKYQPAFTVADKASGRVLPKPRKAVSLRQTRGSAFAAALPAIVAGLAALQTRVFFGTQKPSPVAA